LNRKGRFVLFGVMVTVVTAMWVFAFLSKRFEKVAAGVIALPHAEFERFTLVTLGSGGTFENHWRRGPALAIGEAKDLLLIDAGRAVTESLRAAAIPLRQVRLLLLTSLAAENVLGLDELWLTGWLRGREESLVVHGPAGTRALVEGLTRALARQADDQAAAWDLAPAGRAIEVHEVTDATTLTWGALTARGEPLAGAPTPTLAWRVATDSFSAVVALGSADGAALVHAAQDADFWVTEAIYGASLDRAHEAGSEGLEAMLREAEAHPRLEALGGLAQRAGVRSLVLTRLRPPPPFAFQYEDVVEQGGFRGPVYVPDDGERLTP
jgi:ribonuclease BN (tRNA processing enzyme)